MPTTRQLVRTAKKVSASSMRNGQTDARGRRGGAVITIETFNDFLIGWRWRAVLTLGGTRVILTESHKEDTHFHEDDARKAGEETVASHLKQQWRMS